MASEIVRCANCLAPLRLDAGPIARCDWCGVQTRLDAPTAAVVAAASPSAARLVEAVAFVTPTRKIPFLEASSPVPIFRTETLSTSSDDQTALNVVLVQGDTPITSFAFPIERRGPRGVPKIALTVRVSATGAMSITVAEPGTSNILDRAGMTVRVA